MLQSEAKIILITGNMASGKSTVAQAVAERLPRSVHLRGDIFRRMIVNGQAEMSSQLSLEAESQLSLRYCLAREVAKRYYEAGFTVVYQDIIIGKTLADTVEAFSGYPIKVVVLCPDPQTIAARDAARSKTGYSDPSEIAIFAHILESDTQRLGYWLDNSHLTVEETVTAILKNISRAV